MNEAHIKNMVGLFFLGPFMIWYSYQSGPPELARKVMFWAGSITLAASGLGYLNTRIGSNLGMGDLETAVSSVREKLREKAPAAAAIRTVRAPASPSPLGHKKEYAPVIDIKGVVVS